MNKQTTKTLVPKLRFPEFWKAGEWEEMKLGDVTYKVGKKNKNGIKFPIYSINNKEGFLPQSDQFEGMDSNNRGYDITLYKIIERNTFAYNPARINIGSLGYSGELHNIIISSLYVCFKAKEIIDDSFLLFFLKTNGFSESVKKCVEGGIRSYLFYENFATINILLPEKTEEQQKIASCLSSIDNVISTQSQKLDSLKAHKRGLMQQLFPTKGETVPKMRFPEFKVSVEWEESTLGQVADYENGKAHENDISEEGKFIVVNSKFISTDGEVKKYTNTAFCIAEKENTLMVLSDLPNGRAIAKCFFVDADNLYTVNQRICKITPIKAVGIMLFYTLNRNPYFLAFDDGVKQTNLKKEDVLNCPILLPKDPKEQQKIADCLTSIDKLITAQNQKLEILKVHKNGLMQQLFPTIKETDK